MIDWLIDWLIDCVCVCVIQIKVQVTACWWLWATSEGYHKLDCSNISRAANLIKIIFLYSALVPSCCCLNGTVKMHFYGTSMVLAWNLYHLLNHADLCRMWKPYVKKVRVSSLFGVSILLSSFSTTQQAEIAANEAVEK